MGSLVHLFANTLWPIHVKSNPSLLVVMECVPNLLAPQTVEIVIGTISWIPRPNVLFTVPFVDILVVIPLFHKELDDMEHVEYSLV